MTHAPHAFSSEVGVTEPNWTPEGGGDKSKSVAQTAEARESRFLEETDGSVLPRNRGSGKIGGMLAAIHLRGADSRGRRPLKTNLPSDMEFKRHRQIRTLGDKIAEISRLREEVVRQQRLLSGEEAAVVTGRALLRPISRGSDAGGSVSGSRRADVVRSAVSNQTFSPVGRLRKEVILLRSGSAGDHRGDLELEAESAPLHRGSQGSPLRGIRKGLGPNGAKAKPPSPSLEEAAGQQTYPHDPSAAKAVGSLVQFKGESSLDFANTSQRRLNAAEESESAVVLSSELRRLDNAQIEAAQKLHHYEQDEHKVVALKQLEKAQTARERSRDIERKRRLLSEKAGRRTGPPPEDHHNVYDYYAVRVQSVIRGFIARCWIRWFIDVSLKACRKLQAALRGWFGRMRVRRIRRNFHAARTIQRNFRGWSTRVSLYFEQQRLVLCLTLNAGHQLSHGKTTKFGEECSRHPAGVERRPGGAEVHQQARPRRGGQGCV